MVISPEEWGDVPQKGNILRNKDHITHMFSWSVTEEGIGWGLRLKNKSSLFHCKQQRHRHDEKESKDNMNKFHRLRHVGSTMFKSIQYQMLIIQWAGTMALNIDTRLRRLLSNVTVLVLAFKDSYQSDSVQRNQVSPLNHWPEFGSEETEHKKQKQQ